MPIFRINDQLHYFAHVPKCGGTAIRAYLTERFGTLGFDDPGRELVPENQLWNRTSAEHVPAAALERLVPRDWLATSFAVVRHPLRRLLSAFFFARDVSGSTPLSSDFNTWFREESERAAAAPFRHDGHLATQSSFVPNGSRIFRFEAGLDQVVPYLDELAGNSDGSRHIPARNVGKWRNEEAPPVLTDQTLELISQIYAADFARFGYEVPVDARSTTLLPDLPALAATGAPPVPQRRSLLRRIERHLIRTMERK